MNALYSWHTKVLECMCVWRCAEHCSLQCQLSVHWTQATTNSMPAMCAQDIAKFTGYSHSSPICFSSPSAPIMNLTKHLVVFSSATSNSKVCSQVGSRPAAGKHEDKHSVQTHALVGNPTSLGCWPNSKLCSQVESRPATAQHGSRGNQVGVLSAQGLPTAAPMYVVFHCNRTNAVQALLCNIAVQQTQTPPTFNSADARPCPVLLLNCRQSGYTTLMLGPEAVLTR